MITRTTAYTIDLDRGTVETRWDSPLTYGDKGADRIQVTLTRGSSPATLSGLSVMLYGVRSDGITAIKAGSVSGNVVTAELDYTFYAIPGRLELLLQLTEGTTVVNTPLRITAYVKPGQTDEMVRTGEQFSLAELQAVVAACQSATSSATSAATSANGAATAANTAAGNAQDAADAITGITAEASAVAYGNPPTATVEKDPGDGHLNLVLGLPTGPTGIRGTITYSGTAITGTSTTPTAYATGITDAIVNDRYLYNGTVDAQRGNVYRCTLGGNAATALWVYDGNIRGTAGTGSVNTVDSVSPDVNGNVVLNALPKTGGNMTGAINEALVSSMALAGTMNIGAAAGNYIIVTAGTGPITAFDSAPAGARRFMRFSVSATINYNATTTLIPGAANLAVVSGDVLEWVSGGAGVWQCVNIERWNRIEPSTLQLAPMLLWTNPAPSSDFAAQTVSIDLSAYAKVRIETKSSTTRRGRLYDVYIGETAQIDILANGYVGLRTAAASASGVVFSGGSLYLSYAGTLTANYDGYAIPTKIFGIK